MTAAATANRPPRKSGRRCLGGRIQKRPLSFRCFRALHDRTAYYDIKTIPSRVVVMDRCANDKDFRTFVRRSIERSGCKLDCDSLEHILSMPRQERDVRARAFVRRKQRTPRRIEKLLQIIRSSFNCQDRAIVADRQESPVERPMDTLRERDTIANGVRATGRDRPDVRSVDFGSKTMLFDWGRGRGPDGLVEDAAGRLYVAGGLNRSNPPYEPDDTVQAGIYVIDIDGQILDFLAVPTDEVTNCTLGGADSKTLYITGGGVLYSIRLR